MDWTQFGGIALPSFSKDQLKYTPGELNDYGQMSGGGWGFNNPYANTTMNDQWLKEQGIPDWMFKGGNLEWQGDQSAPGLKIKSAEKEGTVVPYKLDDQGNWVPDMEKVRTQAWDSTGLDKEAWLVMAAAAAALGGGALMGAQAGAGAGAGGGGTGLTMGGSGLGGGLTFPTSGVGLGGGLNPSWSALIPESLAPALGLSGTSAFPAAGFDWSQIGNKIWDKVTDPTNIKSVIDKVAGGQGGQGGQNQTQANIAAVLGGGAPYDSFKSYKGELNKMALRRAALEADALRNGPKMFNPNPGAQNV